MNLMDVREAIVAILMEGLGGMWQGYPYMIDQFAAPAFFVADPIAWDYSRTMDRGVSVTLPIRFALPRADEQSAQEMIAALMSTDPGSPYDILDANVSLNDTVDSSRVARAGRIASYRTGGGDLYLGFELELEIEA